MRRNLSDYLGLLAERMIGMRLALFMIPLVLMSCLVTDNAQVPEEGNLPPSIVTGETANTMGVGLGQIIRIDVATFEGSELSIPVIVRDPNFDQALEYNAYVDFEFEDDLGSLVAGGTIPANEGLERDFVLQVPVTELTEPKCHKIELLVSSRFLRQDAFRQSADPTDIARAVWWVSTIDTEAGVLSTTMDGCPSF